MSKTKMQLNEMIKNLFQFNEMYWVRIQPWKCNSVKSLHGDLCHLMQSYLTQKISLCSYAQKISWLHKKVTRQTCKKTWIYILWQKYLHLK